MGRGDPLVIEFIQSIPERLGLGSFWGRQLCHAVGGGFLGGLAWLAGHLLGPGARPFCFSIIGGTLAVFLYWLEIEDRAKGQSKVKTIVDLLAWTLPFLSIMAFA